MPNWCDNNIRIEGPEDQLLDFFNEVQDEDDGESFEIAKSLMPMPEILQGSEAPARDEDVAKEAIAKTGHRDWYDWANDDSNWGTKWGDCDTNLWFNETKITGCYQTAWGPMSEAFWIKVSETYPKLRISVGYREEGMAFEGAYSFTNGECVYSHSAETSPFLQEAVEAVDRYAGKDTVYEEDMLTPTYASGNHTSSS
jgi:hypothetical protein